MADEAPTPQALDSSLKEMSNRTLAQLKSIARQDGLQGLSGPKASLQDKIRNRLMFHFHNRDVPRFNQMRASIYNEHVGAAASSNNASPASSHNYSHTSISGSKNARHTVPMDSSITPANSGRLAFKESAFYVVIRSLTPIKECPVRESTRDTMSCSIACPPEAMGSASSLHQRGFKIMVFSTADAPSSHGQADIAFPNQIDVRVNGAEVRANFRGLKNKPGSTRPVDITELLKSHPKAPSEMTVSYALTTKPFYVVVNLVEERSCEALVDKLQRSKSIAKERVLSEMRSRAQDNEIEATATRLSLKCPLSTLRMVVPCRSAICAHNQCFDALSFIQLQQQAPTWICPICSKGVSFEALQVDMYVCSILESTPTWVDQVTVEPDGRWSMVPSNLPTKGRSTQLGNTDCDVVEIDGQSSEKRVTQPTPSSRTPTTSSREASITSNAKSSGSKRPHSVMIDLTLSSDDEEEAKRETKRYVNSQGNRQEAQASRFSGNRGRDAGATTPTSATAPAQSTNSNRDHSQHAFDFGFSR